MSKLIVDEIQKNGGDTLTLPTSDAAISGQPLIGSSTGVLSFGSTAMPSADGTNGQVLTTNGAGVGSWSTNNDNTVPSDNDLAIGALFSHANRDNIYSTGSWATTGPNSTYHNELDDSASIVAAWNMLLGDGKPQESGGANNELTYSGNWGVNRYKQFAHNRRLGYNYRYFYWHPNGTSYPGCTFMCVPIRNNFSKFD